MRLILIVFTFFFISCSLNSQDKQPEETLNGHWSLKSMDNVLVDQNRFIDHPSGEPTVKFDIKKNKITGFSGCDGFRGDVIYGENKITVAKEEFVISGCPSNPWATKFYNSFLQIEDYIFENGELILLGKSGKTMRFTRKILHPLEEFEWELIAVNDTLFNIKDFKKVEQPSIGFAVKAGGMGGFSGCTFFYSPVVFFENHYEIEKPIKNPICISLKEWTENFFKMLTHNKHWEIVNKELILTSEEGETLKFKVKE